MNHAGFAGGITRARAGLTLAVLGLAASPLFAQAPDPVHSVFYGNLTSSQQSDVQAWSVYVFQRLEAGGGSPGAGFAFSGNMASQLFNPLRSARSTLEAVKAIDESLCDDLETPATQDPEALAARAAFKDAMVGAKISTSVIDDPVGSSVHLNLILGAPAGSSVASSIEGDKLVSQNLPLEKVSVAVAQAALELNLSARTQQMMSDFIESGATWAAAAGNGTEWQKAVTGATSRADGFADTVRLYMMFFDDGSMNVQPIRALFGVHGELPIVGVQLGDAYVLLDAISGNFSGPFKQGEPINASGLLQAYPDAYAAGTGIRYVSAAGCPTTVVGTWHDSPPPGSWTPSAPTVVPPSTTVPKSNPGWWQPWQCFDTVGGKCKCTSGGSDDKSPATTPATRTPTQILCTNCTPPAAGCGAIPVPKSPTTPNTPPVISPGTPPVVPTPGTFTGCDCKKQWSY